MEHIFNSRNFSATANTEEGDRIWQFLNDEHTIIRLETASLFNKPALLGIERQLLEGHFLSARDQVSEQDKAKHDRVKQMVGAMVKQVMARHGYQLHASNVKVPSSQIFYSASVYRRKE